MILSKPGIRLFGIIILSLLLCIPVCAYSDDATRWFEEGNMLIQAGNYSLAGTAFDNAIEQEPGYFEAWDAKADSLNRAGEFSEALKASSRALEINPRYVRGWINRGQILYNIGYYYEDRMNNIEKADQYYYEQLLAFEKAIELDPENTEAWFNKGYALAGMKDYDAAIVAFDKVQALDPAYPNLELSQKQARVLRDAATPLYVKFALPLIGSILLIIIIGGIFWSRRSARFEPEDPAAENRNTRGKKER